MGVQFHEWGDLLMAPNHSLMLFVGTPIGSNQCFFYAQFFTNWLQLTIICKENSHFGGVQITRTRFFGVTIVF